MLLSSGLPSVPPAVPKCSLSGKPVLKGNVTLSCKSSSGKPIPLYKWKKTSPTSEVFFSPMLSESTLLSNCWSSLRSQDSRVIQLKWGYWKHWHCHYWGWWWCHRSCLFLYFISLFPGKDCVHLFQGGYGWLQVHRACNNYFVCLFFVNVSVLVDCVYCCFNF